MDRPVRMDDKLIRIHVRRTSWGLWRLNGVEQYNPRPLFKRRCTEVLFSFQSDQTSMMALCHGQKFEMLRVPREHSSSLPRREEGKQTWEVDQSD